MSIRKYVKTIEFVGAHGACAVTLIFVLSAGSWICAASGSSEAQGHPVGLSKTPGARLVIKDIPLIPPQPMFSGERFVLTTIGSEHESSGSTEFHPLVSVLVDYSFAEAPQGRWLALWNLGHRTPSAGDRFGAVFPAFISSKKSHVGALRKLEKKRQGLEENPARGGSALPKPFLKATEEKYRANEHLVLEGIKRGLGTIVGFWTRVGPIAYSAHVLYRNYLLRHTDMKERQFEQAFLGLTWYTDLATHTPEADSLSAQEISDLKFKLLASRHFFGRFVKQEEAADFVHGFESEMREHMWGTSCLLASVANEHQLSYEEFHRYTAGEVPVALGGVLYYDPELVPEPSSVPWPSFNPFDLTNSPFENPDVLQAASSGNRVPLAIYVYQSNMAFKPIIAVDFFDPDNPRTRKAATYWHKLGDQALAVYSGVGLYIWAANQTGSFAANRKGLTLFSDSKHSLGLEELRLSLASHLYFEEEAADGLADAMDRLLINPLTQPTRTKALRAQIQYLRLARPAQLVRLGRRLRTKQIRKATGARGGVGEQELASYRRYLKRRREIRTLEVFLADGHLPSIPPSQITASLSNLYREALDPDPELVDFLFHFRLDLEERPLLARYPEPSGWLPEVDRVLARLYEAEGRSPKLLTSDLRAVAEKQEKAELELAQEYRKARVRRFHRLTKRHLLVLQQFDENDGDLMSVSPWYLTFAFQFLARAPLVMDLYPEAEVGFRKLEPEIAASLQQALRYLASEPSTDEVPWMEEQKSLCLQAANQANRQLVRFWRDGREGTGPMEVVDGGADRSGGGPR